jgi:hypothetical protein
MKRIGLVLSVTVCVWAVSGCATNGNTNSDNTPPKQSGQKLLFYTLSCADSPHRAVLPLIAAVTAKENGHEPTVILAGDAVLMMKDAVAADIKAIGQPGAAEMLKKAIGLGIPIFI